MILVNEDSPRWLRELTRFVYIKNLLFVYGNVHDLVSFPIQYEGDENVRWTESDLGGFFRRFFTGLNYEVVGWADPVEDLSFATPEMEEVFHCLETGREVPNRATASAGTDAALETPRHSKPSIGLPRTPKEGTDLQRMIEPVDWNRTISRITLALQNTQVPCAFVINMASRLASSPDRLAKEERTLMTKVLKASLLSREVVRPGARWNNVILLICDKMNDLPTFLYINNPRARSIHIEPPDRDERARFIRRYYRHFFNGDKYPEEAPAMLVHDFVDLSEGLSNYEMRSLVSLSLREGIPILDVETGVSNAKRIGEMYKYGVTTSDWDKIESDRLDSAEAFIRSRIKGQNAAIARCLDIVKRAKIGLAAGDTRKSNRPRGVLFFAGPTGVGKTEMAKALAELLFGQEERLLRFDMSEYSVQQADQRLLGAPPGYVGYEEGGQLTNAVKKNPFSILLFDEIEKAHASIFDKFLQILDDGRLTDGKGETVYFSECIIIFTSNLGTVAHSGDAARHVLVNPEMPYVQVRDIILDEIRNHFNFVLGRPEILNRFGDNFVVFDFIKPPLDQEITDLLITKLIRAAAETRKIDITVDQVVHDTLGALAKFNLQHGGRGIRNVVDFALVNPLSRFLFDMNIQPHAHIQVKELIDHGEDAPQRFELSISVTENIGGNA